MAQIYAGRYTAQIEGSFVVFLIGLRVNQFWAVHKWLPVAQAMPPMLKTLSQKPEKGFLGAEQFFHFWPLTTLMLSYWRSFEALEKFARSKEDPHWRAWQDFMRRVGSDGSVGIWHETYLVEPGQYECIYGNMPQFGLAKAANHTAIAPKTQSARQRVAQ
ncbi:DUF4188 domain-containing protein [Sphaerothrix gracilis]|uniref:DUF4188 domain-containing protein n=1 Tax=Sphaerothrix gracilis TaxID=3151835 RepID=UPI0031FBAD4A